MMEKRRIERNKNVNEDYHSDSSIDNETDSQLYESSATEDSQVFQQHTNDNEKTTKETNEELENTKRSRENGNEIESIDNDEDDKKRSKVIVVSIPHYYTYDVEESCRPEFDFETYRILRQCDF